MKHPHISGRSRRHFLQAGAGAVLALGLAPGCARFADAGGGDGEFRFVVINDAHFSTDRCPEFYARVKTSVLAQTPRPELCLFAGDLTDHGTTKQLGGIKEILDSFGMPWRAVIGNHDYLGQTDRADWDKVLPDSLNYSFEHRGWQFVGLDTTEGLKADKIDIQAHTLAWVKEKVPKLRAKAPTVIFTHFPLGPTAPKRPRNADAVLDPFLKLNVAHVFGGHHHGFTERRIEERVFVTNRCCSISKSNHDRTKEKGYFLCTAREGKVVREFVEVPAG
jgi:hypothetical protein